MFNDKITSRRLNIDRKMMSILSLFTVLGVCLLIIIVVISDTMSALRAYSTLQTHWTEIRKEGTFLLVKYLEEQEDYYLEEFNSSLELIDAATIVREELFDKNTDHRIVKEHLLTIHTDSNDMDDMITTFERFHTFPDFTNAINAWIESDRLVGEMRILADQAERMIAERPSDFTRQNQQFINQVRQLDKQLTEVQYDLASSLAAGNNFLSDIILLISTSLGVILLIIGAFLTVRFTRSIRKWSRAIEISEQRYRSLFEQNPNAVFSVTTEGHIVDENEAMKQMTGYSREELSEMKAEHLVIPEERDTVKKLFDEVLQSHPKSFETHWKRINGELLPLYLTYLPIYVDDKIVGVFGIADDITYIKHVEEQLKKQLGEKTLLLAEVHDRVKNNLALISSLLQLQEQTTVDEKAQRNLESTRSRIHSMAMVHERLYHVESFSNVRMDEYIRELVKSTQTTFGSGEEIHKVIIEADPISLDVKSAIPCGLLLNELIVNAFQHGVKKDSRNKILIRLNRIKDDIHIQVKDNGKGLGDNFDIDEQNNLGMILVRTLAKQLEGKLEIKSNSGTEVNLVFRSEQKILQSA